MPALGFEAAWQEYRRAEKRLPPKPSPVAPTHVAGVTEIAAWFDLIVLDAWGVLNLGDQPIESARSAVAALRRLGKRILVASNDGTRDTAAAAARHRGRGFDFAEAEIVAGIDLLPEALAQLPQDAAIGLIADRPAPYPALTGPMRLLDDHAAAYDQVAAVVFLSSDAWSEARQELLQSSLAQRPRPLIVGNPDIVSPEPWGMTVEPGFYAHRIADATAVRPTFCGKPFSKIYRRLHRLHPEIAADRVLCVGDTLHTDILGGRAAGFRTLLIEDGFCRGRDGLALAADSGIWPDFIAPRL